VKLAYKDSPLEMYVFLPDTNSSPEKLLAIMNGHSWQKTTTPGFTQAEGMLWLPRFKFKYGTDLVKPLKALGIHRAFDTRADFSAMSGESLYISDALQKAYVEVNEEGTEAAAATLAVATFGGIEMNPVRPFEMIVDRPFLVVIADSESGTILFMGVIFDPSQTD